MVMENKFNLYHSFGRTKKKISTIDSKEPLNLTNKIIFFFLFCFFCSLLRSGCQKEKERLKTKLGIFGCSSFLWRQDQVEDRDRNDSGITWPRTSIKNGVCVRIWI